MPTLQIPIISGPDDGTFWGRLNALSNSRSQVSVGHFSGTDGGSSVVERTILVDGRRAQ